MFHRVKKILLVVLCIYIFLLVFATVTWNYRPTMYNNMNYKTVTELDITNVSDGSLFVVQHIPGMRTYEQMIMCEECLKNNLSNNIVSKICYNKKAEFFKNLPMFTSYNLIKIDEFSKNNKTKLIVNKLKNNENVIIFLEMKNEAKGIYHILKETKKQLILVNIQDMDNEPSKIFNKQMELSYRKVEYPIEKESEEFMTWLKDKLYNEPVFERDNVT